ncbi:hypothetical protein IPZ58_07565 [Streptomyces roseoverticillatus]|uniref:hypothetical protein n=1 Tax=Streptomyces roseoverticillatus TaxID=66429 RepID=UPI001F404BA3|nr:hypothetical protein [Streptomyces roseoverticillatus]MCF3101437.1 hypothetical protein [Streptomyces roseoverticillatus]
MTALQQAAQRLTLGSVALAQRIAGGVCAWCSRSYRRDLTGWRASLGPGVRSLIILGGGVMAARQVRDHPGLLWLLAPAWCAAAWSAGSEAPVMPQHEEAVEGEPEAQDGAPEEVTLDELASLVRELAQDGAGAHLSVLAEHLPGGPHDTAAVRALCATHGVPVSKSVRQPGRGVSTGVKVADLPLLSPAPPEGPAVAVVDAGQDATTDPATATATPAYERRFGGILQTIPNPDCRTDVV